MGVKEKISEWYSAVDRFAENPAETRKEVENFLLTQGGLNERVRREIEEAESANSTTAIPPNYYFLLGPDAFVNLENPSKVDVFLGVGIFYIFQKTGATSKLMKKYDDDLDAFAVAQELVTTPKLQERISGRLGSFKKGENFQSSYFLFKAIPEAIIGDIDFPFIVSVLKDEITIRGSRQKFRSIINHEVTHAYIYEETDIRRGNDEVSAINEGAAHVVTYATSDMQPSPEGYQADGIPKQLLHTAEYAIYSVERERDGNTIDIVREEAVRAIERAENGDMDIVEAFESHEIEELRELKKSLGVLEEVEHKTFHVVQLLGLISSDRDLEYVRKIDSALENQYLNDVKELFPEETPLPIEGKKIEEEVIDVELDMDAEMNLDEDMDDEELDTPDISIGSEAMDEMLEEVFGETLEGDVRSTLEDIEGGMDDLERIEEKLVEEGREKEAKEIEEVRKGLKNMLEIYSTEKDEKINRILDSIQEKGSNIGPGKIKLATRPESTSANHLPRFEQKRESLVSLMRSFTNYYGELLNVCIKYTLRMEKILEKLHDEEEKVAEIAKEHREKEEYHRLDRMLKLTEDVHRISETGRKECQEAKNALRTLNESLS